jgi:hypothetical protein
MQPLHNRMPVILGAADYGKWMDPAVQEPGLVLPLLAPCLSTRRRLRIISFCSAKLDHDAVFASDQSGPTTRLSLPKNARQNVRQSGGPMRARDVRISTTI